ncbi:eukaryotic initiation factor 4A [Micractinium conductrix]|uniref:Eukaryotic initiation factor 4A n=1 Tax=Micractinium conductrix TaxID=554055 RepID=A0A2P6VHT1_9CHLO|nr:eukaryotic initiation factor 4A [Micractinium conductrix]|eukprot:PSC73642.1 eukaryotic initiation factor 4A [Micractinium conductrix]
MDRPAQQSAALRHFYVAVSSAENKLATLLDLLRAFEATAPLSLVVCCGSRDSLDAVVAAAVGVTHCRVWVLHADLSEREVEATVRDYRAAATPAADQQQQPPGEQQAGEGHAQQRAGAGERRRAAAGGPPGRDEAPAAAPPPFVAVLACTDAALRVLPKELLPLSPTLLVSYDLPTRKDVYLRRVSHVLGSRSSAGGRRIAVNFAVAGQLAELRQVEEFSEKPIEEMPVHVSDIFAQA